MMKGSILDDTAQLEALHDVYPINMTGTQIYIYMEVLVHEFHYIIFIQKHEKTVHPTKMMNLQNCLTGIHEKIPSFSWCPGKSHDEAETSVPCRYSEP